MVVRPVSTVVPTRSKNEAPHGVLFFDKSVDEYCEREVILFKTVSEAEDVNSDCAFCRKPKFVVLEDEGMYNLNRCAVKGCVKHCSWDHKGEKLQIDNGGKDVVAIVSGWV